MNGRQDDDETRKLILEIAHALAEQMAREDHERALREAMKRAKRTSDSKQTSRKGPGKGGKS